MGSSESKEENIVVAQQASQIAPVNNASGSVGAVDIIAICFVLMLTGVVAYMVWRCLKREIDMRVTKGQRTCTISHV